MNNEKKKFTEKKFCDVEIGSKILVDGRVWIKTDKDIIQSVDRHTITSLLDDEIVVIF